MTNDPIARFAAWFADAQTKSRDPEPSAMTLATADKSGAPSARVVLLKSFDEHGFVFYTNMQSRKSHELEQNPRAALCFNWIAAGKQVRVEGRAERVSDAQADVYFKSRPLASRISAIASDQSRPLPSREALMAKVETLEEQYSEVNPPPRPAYWSGWRIVPERIEFWSQGQSRLHERERFTRDGQSWRREMLYP